MTMLSWILLIVIAAIGGAFALAPRSILETRIMIDAPPDRVWAVLADRAAYGQWNPLVTASDGPLVAGGTITNHMRFRNGTSPVFKARLLVVEPGRQLRWLGRFMVPRIVDGEHYFVLQAKGEGTELIHGEDFVGIALWFVSVEQFRADFEGFNRALKQRVESGGQ
jgi:hypothetical protein